MTRALFVNAATLRDALGRPPDLVEREITLAEATPRRATLLYFNDLADAEKVGRHIIAPLLRHTDLAEERPTLRWYEDRLTAADVRATSSIDEILTALQSGNTCVLISGFGQALLVATAAAPHRAIEEPAVEAVTRGPREGFVELLATNTGLLRKRLRHSGLRLEEMAIGQVSPVKIVVAYIEGIARHDLLAEVRDRLADVSVDSLQGSGQLEELIKDHSLSLFPTVQTTERPDVVSFAILEGRVSIMIDGSPFALILPATINTFMQAPDDYYTHYAHAALVRIVRWVALVSALSITSVYVAVSAYNPEVIPTNLLFTIAGTHESVPFPVLVEALLMEVAFEVLREAGIRTPVVLGNTISIVGVLVVGNAAVAAGLVSPIMVVLVGMTALATFAIPDFTLANAVRILRFVVILAAGTLGLFGVAAALLSIFIHVLKLRSLDIPIMDPFVPATREFFEDGLARAPWFLQFTRPRSFTQRDARRRREPTTRPSRRDRERGGRG